MLDIHLRAVVGALRPPSRGVPAGKHVLPGDFRGPASGSCSVSSRPQAPLGWPQEDTAGKDPTTRPVFYLLLFFMFPHQRRERDRERPQCSEGDRYKQHGVNRGRVEAPCSDSAVRGLQGTEPKSQAQDLAGHGRWYLAKRGAYFACLSRDHVENQNSEEEPRETDGRLTEADFTTGPRAGSSGGSVWTERGDRGSPHSAELTSSGNSHRRDSPSGSNETLTQAL